MAANYDYITMLNMPELSPPSTTEDFQSELDLWLNTDFSFDPLDNADIGPPRNPEGLEFDFRSRGDTFVSPELTYASTFQEPAVPSPQAQVFNSSVPIAPTASAPSVVTPQINAVPIPTSAFQNEPLPTTNAGMNLPFPAFPTLPDANAMSNMTFQQILAAASALGNKSVVKNLASVGTANILPKMATPAASLAASITAPVTVPESFKNSSAASVYSEGDDKTEEEIDKRRRNTAASARFRAKKKMREQALERTAKSMTDKADQLERRVKEYEMELKWLRQLVTDRDGKKRLRDVYEENGLTFIEGTAAAGCSSDAQPQAANPNVSNVNLAAAAAAFAGVMALAGQPMALPLPPTINSTNNGDAGNKRARVQ
ncbi:hypothetical protein DFS34DRAFT_603806 [Phlyctochytrium arcticum]|nr:hypothetical protein DFS34DRAFT_603806 [Phlyctochytrium arcticum]